MLSRSRENAPITPISATGPNAKPLVSEVCICTRHGNCVLNIVAGRDQAPSN